jgi:DNA mismatch repair protein MutS
MNIDTPMMKQYNLIKKEYPDSILFFRMGDFYEMFGEDAKVGSKVLGIALTSRTKGQGEKIPLCGIPYHALDRYLEKMVDSGFTVAICDQVEDPKIAIGIVKREIVRLVTPSTLIRTGKGVESDNTYLASIYATKNDYGFAYVDLATGEFRGSTFSGENAKNNLKNEVMRLEPREILLPESQVPRADITDICSCESILLLTKRDDWFFSTDRAVQILKEHFQVLSLDGIGLQDKSSLISSSGAIVNYLSETQKSTLEHINRLHIYNLTDYMILDSSTLRNLEILKNAIDSSRNGTLLDIIDFTSTPMGKRLIRSWLTTPLLDIGKINQRLEAVSVIRTIYALLRGFETNLDGISDIERIISKISLGSANARDLVALKDSLSRIPKIKDLIEKTESGPLKVLIEGFEDNQDVVELIQKTIVDEPPIAVKEGGIIRSGYDSELDEIKKISLDGKAYITSLEERERKRTGINSLKVRYNKVFGYYIEITKSNLEQVPIDYVRKQTLVNAERFITPELKEYEEKVVGAEERLCEMEYEIFFKIREQIGRKAKEIQKSAGIIAQIDVLTSFAKAAATNNWEKPRVNDTDGIKIIEGRHPVIERLMPGMKFVPNDLDLDGKDRNIIIITGPNMAGKSTYIRQVALIVLLAQVGSFIPAKEADIGVVDRIFTRVGASDHLVRGLSTFMVEMNETANILNNATPKSLIILDEIGRGTSTYDGLSIAWSVVEYIHNSENLKAKTLFATHYHELADIVKVLPNAKNMSMAIREWEDQIVFLYKVIDGSVDRSYGVEVARLAGLPNDVIYRAREVLAELENKDQKVPIKESLISKKSTIEKKQFIHHKQLSLFSDMKDPIIARLNEIDVNNLTPLQALEEIIKLKDKINKPK